MAGELPLKRRGSRVVAFLQLGKSLPGLGQIGEVVGRHDFALHHCEEDLTWFTHEAWSGMCTMTSGPSTTLISSPIPAILRGDTVSSTIPFADHRGGQYSRVTS